MHLIFASTMFKKKWNSDVRTPSHKANANILNLSGLTCMQIVTQSQILFQIKILILLNARHLANDHTRCITFY